METPYTTLERIEEIARDVLDYLNWISRTEAELTARQE